MVESVDCKTHYTESLLIDVSCAIDCNIAVKGDALSLHGLWLI